MLLNLMVFKADAISSLPVEVQDEELSIDRYMAEGDQLVLFISAGMGLPERVRGLMWIFRCCLIVTEKYQQNGMYWYFPRHL